MRIVNCMPLLHGSLPLGALLSDSLHICFHSSLPSFLYPQFSFISSSVPLSFYMLLPICVCPSLSLLKAFSNLTKSDPNPALVASLCGFAALQLGLGFHYTEESKRVRAGLIDGWLEVKRDRRHQGKRIKKTLYSGWMWLKETGWSWKRRGKACSRQVQADSRWLAERFRHRVKAMNPWALIYVSVPSCQPPSFRLYNADLTLAPCRGHHNQTTQWKKERWGVTERRREDKKQQRKRAEIFVSLPVFVLR